MQQEDYNSIMRHPSEVRENRLSVLQQCPNCNERYFGNGKVLCIECETDTKNLEDHLQDAFPVAGYSVSYFPSISCRGQYPSDACHN